MDSTLSPSRDATKRDFISQVPSSIFVVTPRTLFVVTPKRFCACAIHTPRDSTNETPLCYCLFVCVFACTFCVGVTGAGGRQQRGLPRKSTASPSTLDRESGTFQHDFIQIRYRFFCAFCCLCFVRFVSISEPHIRLQLTSRIQFKC